MKKRFLSLLGLTALFAFSSCGGTSPYQPDDPEPTINILKADLKAGESLSFPVDNIKKNKVIVFSCDIAELPVGVTIGHGKTQYSSAYLTIDAENVTVNNCYSSLITSSYKHNLSIETHLSVYMQADNIGNTDVTIISDSGSYTIPAPFELGCSNAGDYVECTVGSLTNCVFSMSCKDLQSDLFVFGDSYLGINYFNRWGYYLHEHGYDNMLINAYPGETSSIALTTLKNILSYATPKKLLWCLGMNDGSDINSEPSKAYMDALLELITICNGKGIELILSTIPTCPVVNNEQKNQWVRNSGYRYVDFAEAVGAQSDGTWYEGMLYSDNVHPTALGAKALYFRAVLDCPELTY